MVLIILAIVLMEKVNAMKVGQDYGEDIEAAATDGEPDPKEKEKVEKKEKEKEKNKSSQQKKGFSADAFKKLNRQRQGGCGFFGTIGCNRWIFCFDICINGLIFSSSFGIKESLACIFLCILEA